MRVEGTYEYDYVEFDYKAYIEKGGEGDYWTPPAPDTIYVEFVGFLPDVDLTNCLKGSIIEKIQEKIQEEL